MRHTTFTGSAIFTLAVILLSTNAAAESLNPILDDTWSLKMGAIFNTADIDAIVSVAPLPPTPITLDFLGLNDDHTNFWLAGRWRFGKKWALNFSYDSFKESGSNIATKNFNFDGVMYPTSASLEADMRADAYIMDVSYSIWKGSNFEAGLGLGLHAFNLKTGIDAQLVIDDETVIDYRAQSDSLIAPVPNLRLFGTFAFNPKASLTVQVGWLSLNYGNFEGGFRYIAPSLEYRFGEKFSAGMGYRYTDIDIEHDSGGGDFEEYNMEFNGITAYISYDF